MSCVRPPSKGFWFSATFKKLKRCDRNHNHEQAPNNVFPAYWQLN